MTNPYEYNWTFGDHTIINFPAGGDPVLASGMAFLTAAGSATISDASGNLLFYTDGENSYNSSHVQTNPTSLPLGGRDTTWQSSIIIPPAGGGEQLPYYI